MPSIMESTAISNSLIPYNNRDVLNNNLETTHKNIIQSILEIVNNFKNVIISVNNLNTKLVCTFRNIEVIEYEKLKQIYLLGNQIQKMTIYFINQFLQVNIKKNNFKKDITIKRKKVDLGRIDLFTRKILDQHNIPECDSRMCFEVVRLIFKWTWGKLAAKIDIQVQGGEYLFKVYKLRTLTYSQLQYLVKVHDAIKGVLIDLKNSVLSFKVVRSNEYITNNTKIKKTRYE